MKKSNLNNSHPDRDLMEKYADLSNDLRMAWKELVNMNEKIRSLEKEIDQLKSATLTEDRGIQGRSAVMFPSRAVKRHKKTVDQMSDSEINALIDKKRKKNNNNGVI